MVLGCVIQVYVLFTKECQICYGRWVCDMLHILLRENN